MMRAEQIASLALVCGTATLVAQAPTFSSRIDAVRVDALVTDSRGQPIPGLEAGDFEVTDAGVPQRVDLVIAEQLPLSVVLAFDLSGSLERADAAQLRTAGNAVLDGLKPGDKAALVTFTSAVSIPVRLTSNLSLIRSALDEEPTEFADTSVFDGAYTAMLLAGADTARGLVILFTDGEDTSSALSGPSVLDSARRADAVVYAVVAGKADSPRFLNELGNATGGRVLKVGSMSKLRDAFLVVLEEFRHRYVLSYTPRGATRNGWHALTVRVRNRRAVVNARPGYMAGS